jgi:hypothetical protein
MNGSRISWSIVTLLAMGVLATTGGPALGCVDCPPGAIQEGEPTCYVGYADHYNPGCLGGGFATFMNIPYSETGTVVCGTDGATWDWDAYRIVLPVRCLVRVCLTAEAATTVSVGALSESGTETYCMQYATGSGLACQSFCVEANVPAGPAWLRLAPISGPCGSRYTVTVTCTPVRTPMVVLNEIDYDQPSLDTSEFIELKNTDTVAADLGMFSVQLVNGFNGGAAVYQVIQLPSVSLAPGGYYVICANPGTVSNCDLDVTPDTNLIQNGAPDAVALLADGVIVDSVSYEGNTGALYTEGSGVGLIDDGTLASVGISRYPDGVDTNMNNADWSPRCITPGRANSLRNSSCDAPVAVDPAHWGTVKSLYR